MNKHPEDEIYAVSTFINELTKVQDERFTKLSDSLNLTERGDEMLFDYVYNCFKDGKYDDFESYWSYFGNTKEIIYNEPS